MSSITESQLPMVPPVGPDPWRYGSRTKRERGPDGVERIVVVPLSYEDLLHPEEGDRAMITPGHDVDCYYLKYCCETRTRDRAGWVVLHECRIVWGVEGLLAHGPDIAVFDQVATWDRRAGTFYAGALGARVRLLIEVTSPDNFQHDLVDKVREYWQARVPFYVIVHRCAGVDQDQLRLLGYRWTPCGYSSVSLDENDRLPIELLDLWLGIEGDRVACYDRNGQRIPDPAEAFHAVESEKARAEVEKARAEAEKARAEVEKARAEAAIEAKRIADARMQELEAELRRLRGEP